MNLVGGHIRSITPTYIQYLKNQHTVPTVKSRNERTVIYKDTISNTSTPISMTEGDIYRLKQVCCLKLPPGNAFVVQVLFQHGEQCLEISK
jgi:hypothetical protein